MDFNKAKTYALRRLSSQAMTQKQMRDALIRKGASVEDSDKVLLLIEGYGYLDDAAWAEGFVRGQRRKGAGPQLIRLKMREKGISSEIAAPLIEEARLKQCDQIRAHIEKKRPDLENVKEVQKLIAYLMRKGFDFEEIRQFIDLN
jgi:regulatory protein